MKQLAEDRAKVPQVLRTLYAPIRAELDRVEEILREELRSDHPFVDQLVKHGFRLGGKRMRPALVLLSAKAAGRLNQEHLVLAAAVEMIHTATLIHDDVLDEATLRRHLDTVNARWDNEASILLGDYLFTRSIRMASAVDGPFACRAIGEAAQTMCEGELRQVASRGNYDLDETDYLEIIANKTAALTACCCRLGSHYAGADPQACETLTQFGRYLGIAFQIADDLLDVLGDEVTAGKSLGTDLLKQKPTLPLIRLLSQVDEQDRAKVLAVLERSSNHRREALRSWFDRFDAISYARQKAIYYTERAADLLDSLPETEGRNLLKEMTVLQNVVIACHLHTGIGLFEQFLRTARAREKQKAVEENAMVLLETMGIAHVKDEIAGELPHGHQRALGIAIALAAKPKLLLLDEPVGGMNPSETQDTMDRIKTLHEKGITVLLVEHDMRAVMTTCAKITVINFGQKIAEGTPQEVSKNKPVIEAYLGRGRSYA